MDTPVILDRYHVQLKDLPKWKHWLLFKWQWYHDNVALKQPIWNVYDTEGCRTIYRNHTHVDAHRLTLKLEELRRTYDKEYHTITAMRNMVKDKARLN